MADDGNIVDFESSKLAHIQKRKDSRADEMRKAFRAARGDEPAKPRRKSRKRRGKTGHK